MDESTLANGLGASSDEPAAKAVTNEMNFCFRSGSFNCADQIRHSGCSNVSTAIFHQVPRGHIQELPDCAKNGMDHIDDAFCFARVGIASDVIYCEDVGTRTRIDSGKNDRTTEQVEHVRPIH